MKTKNILAVIFGMAFLFLALAPMASASTWLKFEANSSASSLTVSQGDQVNLVLVASSHNNIPVSSEKLYANSYLLHQWDETGSQSGSTYVWNKNYALNTGILNPGTYTLKFLAKTNAGSEQSTLTLIINQIDNTAPVITILGNNTEIVTLGSTYVDAGATAFDNVDGDLTSSIVTTNNVDTSTVGTYTVIYDVTDNAGNSAQATRTVNVVNGTDVTAPTINISSPTDGGIYSTPVTDIAFTVTDNEALSECWYSLDGGITNVSTSCANGIPNTITVGAALFGINNWTIYANDTAGNLGSATTHFNQTSAPLTITPISPIDGDNLDYTDVILAVTLSEEGYVNYSIDGGANVTMTEITSLNFESISLELADSQDHNVTYYATDLNGSKTTSTTITFYVDEIVNQNQEEYNDSSYFSANFTDTVNNRVSPIINLTDDTNSLNWFQRFINWLCRVFGLEEVY